MGVLPQTERAFIDLAANNRSGVGRHTDGTPHTGMEGVYLGAVPFDAMTHSPTDIDPLSAMGIATGEDYVRNVLPGKSLSVNIVVDDTPRREHPIVTRTKDNLALSLADAIDNALPDMTDRIFPYKLAQGDEHRMALQRDVEKLDVRKRGVAQTVAELAAEGLTFVLSDFNRLRFGEEYKGRLSNLIAVKVNHPPERIIPAGVGFVSLGRGIEVNTFEPRQLAGVNRRLQELHEDIVENLQATGAHVVDLVVNPKDVGLFALKKADKGIARALHELQ